MTRLIQKEVLDELSLQIIEGKVSEGGKVDIGTDQNGLRIKRLFL